ncbi:hypothetical protein SEUBUCD646_0H01520 [Saccharomyces eubayanus]|uniref:PIN2-like protein n=2 Tax=Saccharomyces TaxID=4930 RepID=A0ABN8VR46_SACEU|nr:hypothetical protein SEUBUCD650_0H01530 [Saccharomyces eubayanus]CAI2038075.1 hypothetical protein SEUBUCD646_0H01520 [Saccharomyces eubayanus]
MSICKLKNAVSLFPRSSFTDGVVSTSKSFRSWDTCMDNKACKIIAIVGIVLASILVIWLIGGLLTCFRQGVTGIGQFVCWCCHCSGNQNRNNGMPVNEGFNRVNMGAVPPSTVIYQPIQQPENAYYRNDAKPDTFYDEVKTPSNEVYELEEDFDLEKQREKTRRKQRRQRNKEGQSPSRVAPLVYDEDPTENDIPQPQYDARGSFIQNANHTNTNSNSNTNLTGQPPIFDISDYGENYYYNNNNAQGNSNNAHIPDHRSPYPTESHQPYQGYNPNQNQNGRYY